MVRAAVRNNSEQAHGHDEQVVAVFLKQALPVLEPKARTSFSEAPASPKKATLVQYMTPSIRLDTSLGVSRAYLRVFVRACVIIRDVPSMFSYS